MFYENEISETEFGKFTLYCGTYICSNFCSSTEAVAASSFISSLASASGRSLTAASNSCSPAASDSCSPATSGLYSLVGAKRLSILF